MLAYRLVIVNSIVTLTVILRLTIGDLMNSYVWVNPMSNMIVNIRLAAYILLVRYIVGNARNYGWGDLSNIKYLLKQYRVRSIRDYEWYYLPSIQSSLGWIQKYTKYNEIYI